MIKNRVDAHADALAVPTDPHQVLDAIKEKHGEMLASVDAEMSGRGAVAPDRAVKTGGR